MPLQSLLRTSDLSPVDVARLLYHAAQFKQDPGRDAGLLRGRTVVHYFAKPSTRTRLSLQESVARLGGIPVVVGHDDLQLGRGETIADTARIVSGYAAAFTARTYDDSDVRVFAEHASVPVINALTDQHHPLQSLADLLTISDRHGTPAGRRVAYLGDATNVCTSLMEACALAGASIAVASPEAYGPSPEVVESVSRLAEPTGASVSVTQDPAEAVAGADVVYTDVWVSMGDSEDGRAARLAALDPYRVSAELMALAAPEAMFMHCLPAHRGEEVTAEVIDGPSSVVFEQAQNRLWTSMAVIATLVRGQLGGA